MAKNKKIITPVLLFKLKNLCFLCPFETFVSPETFVSGRGLSILKRHFTEV